ncbi:MAG: hypothetical protein ED559_04130 [Phycisphaera sp.]|nr:MAG: hypothetical protein ED559_04130 [Phycisphaera sp.]
MNALVSTILRSGALLTFIVFVITSHAGAQPSPPDQPGGDGGSVNSMCPVMSEEPVDPRFMVQYEGKTIGLCCRRCLTKFEADPAAYTAHLPAVFALLEQTEKLGIQTDQASGDHADDHHPGDHSDAESMAANSAEHTRPPEASFDQMDHAHTHGTGSRSSLAAWIGKFHPASTHLPIGLLFGAAIAEFCMIVTRNARFRHAAGFCLVAAFIGAIIAVVLGWLNGGFVLWDDHWVQATHRWLGTGTAALSLVTLGSFVRAAHSDASRRAVMRYRLALCATTVVVAGAGFFGGALVYGIDHYAL